MFQRETVVVTGAGASWHYGFPTGDQLVTNVMNRASVLQDYCSRARGHGGVYHPRLLQEAATEQDRFGYNEIIRQCEELFRRLRDGNPLVIDYFLGHNRDLEKIGKFLIAWEILEAHERCENKSHNQQRIDARPAKPIQDIPILARADDWIRFFSHAIAADCENSRMLLDNNLHFITFNYDELIEDRLFKQLSSLFEPKLVETFLQNRVTHVYGSVGPKMTGLHNFRWELPSTEENATVLDQVYARSHALGIIEPHSKTRSEDAAKRLANAERIFVLGYGFDEYNSARIGLDMGFHKIPPAMDAHAFQKEIFVTNLCGYDRVRKKLGRMAAGNPNAFIKDRSVMDGRRTIEMSVRNVHDALAYDFEGYDFRAI